MRTGTYRTWTEHVTDEASRAGVTGTPTVKVNGKALDDPSPDGAHRSRGRRPASDPYACWPGSAWSPPQPCAATVLAAAPAAAHGADAPDGTDYRTRVTGVSTGPARADRTRRSRPAPGWS